VDVSKQLHEYEVEYHVLQEEMSSPRPEEMEALRKAEATNRTLLQQNQALVEQLEVLTFLGTLIAAFIVKSLLKLNFKKFNLLFGSGT
jgi:hypothetical protein